MTKHPWSEDTLRQIIEDLWPASLAQLAKELRVTRKVVFRLIGGGHANEPIALLEALHRVLTPKLQKLGHAMGVGDLREAWRRTVAVKPSR
jgi:hypothetical protein